MIVIWRGAGGLVLIFGIVSALITNIVTSSVFKENNYFPDHSWAQAASLWITALACWFLGRFLNSRPPKIMTDKNGREVTVVPNHHLMFIKMEYWGPIFFVIGIGVLIAGAVKH
jgi:hypothetical protein